MDNDSSELLSTYMSHLFKNATQNRGYYPCFIGDEMKCQKVK